MVLELFGVSNDSVLRAEITLSDMGIDSLLVTEVRDILRSNGSTTVSDQQICDLTVCDLRSMCK